MASKKIRVVKSEWQGFAKEFCRQNQFRQMTVAQGDEKIAEGVVFAGISYESESNRIDVLAVGDNPSCPATSVCALEGARGLYIIKSEDAGDEVEGIQLQGKPGTHNITITFEGAPIPDAKHTWITSVAKKCYEARGCEHGKEMDDWLDAEKAIENCIGRLCD